MEVDLSNYVELAKTTNNPDIKGIVERLSDPNTVQLLHAALGLVTEAGEVADVLKKHIFYGKEIDMINLEEEVGDSMWYAAIAIDILQTTFKDVLTKNIVKLKKRYPEKFTKDAALNRDKEHEMSHFKE